jgi:hypothetical protein
LRKGLLWQAYGEISLGHKLTILAHAPSPYSDTRGSRIWRRSRRFLA